MPLDVAGCFLLGWIMLLAGGYWVATLWVKVTGCSFGSVLWVTRPQYIQCIYLPH
jgi:hypothetical protein